MFYVVVNDVVDYAFNGHVVMGDGFKGAIRKVSIFNHAFC